MNLLRHLKNLPALLLCAAPVFSAEAAPDAKELAHEIFGPTANVVTANAALSAPPGAIAKYSRKKSETKAQTKSGVSFSVGGASNNSGSAAAGDQQLSELIGQPTANAAALSFEFQPSLDRQTLRLNFTLAAQGAAEKSDQPSGDVFAVYIDGKLFAFARASDAQPSGDKENPRALTQSLPIDLSEHRMHPIKIALASAGPGGGSTVVVSVDGAISDEPIPPIAASIPPTRPPGGPEIFNLKKFDLPTPTPHAPPPAPPYQFQRDDPVPVPDASNTFFLLLIGVLALKLFHVSRPGIIEYESGASCRI